MTPGAMARVAGWLAASACGYAALSAYDGTPGRAALPPARWPAESYLETSEGRSTMVILLHPGCPCSRASLRELEKILARVPPDSVVTHALVMGPDAEGGSLWRTAAAIPGVRVSADREGVQARVFRAATSGEVVLYDPAGALVFHGGVTPSRAHEGDSAGGRAVVAGIRAARGAEVVTPVFGCALAADAP